LRPRELELGNWNWGNWGNWGDGDGDGREVIAVEKMAKDRRLKKERTER